MEPWMDGVEHIPTAAFGGYGPIKPIAVVNHIMQGYQNTMIDWAKERPHKAQKSAHFTINRKGRIVQHVALDQASWASGSVRAPTWPLLRVGKNPNGYIVNIEHEGFSIDPIAYGYDYLYGPNRPWPEAMVQASIRVQQWVCDQLDIAPNEDTIIGHRRIDGVTRKDDPGDAWPQKRIINALTGSLPPAINKNRAYWEIARGNATPVGWDGNLGIYEIKVLAR